MIIERRMMRTVAGFRLSKDVWRPNPHLVLMYKHAPCRKKKLVSEKFLVAYLVFLPTPPFANLCSLFFRRLISHLSQPASTRSSFTTKSLNLAHLAAGNSNNQSTAPNFLAALVNANQTTAHPTPAATPTYTCFGLW